MLAKLKPLDLAGERVLQAESLNARYGELSPEEIIELSVRQGFQAKSPRCRPSARIRRCCSI